MLWLIEKQLKFVLTPSVYELDSWVEFPTSFLITKKGQYLHHAYSTTTKKITSPHPWKHWRPMLYGWE